MVNNLYVMMNETVWRRHEG